MATSVPGWETTEWKGGRVKYVFMLVFGVFASLVAVPMTIGSAGSDRLAALGVLAFGVAIVAVAPAFRSWDREGSVRTTNVSRPGAVEPAIVFPFARSKTRAVTLAAGAFALAGLAMAFGAESFADDPGDETWPIRLVGGAMFVLFGAMAVLAARNLRGRSFVALTPSGIHATGGGNRTFVPWGVITDIRAFELHVPTRGGRATEPLVAIDVSDPSAVQIPRWARLLMPINRRYGGDITFGVRTLDVEPSELYWTLRHYLERPDDRSGIGTQESLEVARAGRP